MKAPAALVSALSTRGLATSRLEKRFARQGDPRLVAGIALLALANLALLPIVVLACLGSGIAVPGLAAVTGCWPALGSGTARLVEAGLALALLAVLARHTAAAVRQACITTLRGLVRAACRRRDLPGGGCAWVLPVAEPVAYVTGIIRPRVVVSDGLLQLLSPGEQEAVLAHEAAHLRLGVLTGDVVDGPRRA